jgi:hypothetical protein
MRHKEMTDSFWDEIVWSGISVNAWRYVEGEWYEPIGIRQALFAEWKGYC